MKNQAFTLIELLVVVLIIGILAAIAVPQYQKAVDKTRLVTFTTLIKAVAQAKSEYYLATGNWPEKFSDLSITLPSDFVISDIAYYKQRAYNAARKQKIYLYDEYSNAIGVMDLSDNSSVYYYIKPSEGAILSRNVCDGTGGTNSKAAKLCASLPGATYSSSSGFYYVN